MSTRGPRTRSRSKKTSASKNKNGQAEVFVLPPYLLQKLGINLEKVGEIEDCPTSLNNKDGPPGITNNENFCLKNPIAETPKHDESEKLQQASMVRDQSILETASLMKTSVFLSPTFVAMDSNINAKEDEILQCHQTSSNSCFQDAKSVLTQPQIVDVPLELLPNVNIHDQQCLPSQNSNIAPSDQEVNQLVVSSHDTSILTKATRAVSIDDHPDEAYSSDCSNSLGPMETQDFAMNSILEMGSGIPSAPSEHKKKINIIHEEILSHNQMKKTECVHSHKLSSYVPLALNALINENSVQKKSREKIIKEALSEKEINNEISLKQNNASINEYHLRSGSVVLFNEKGDVIKTDVTEVSMDGLEKVHIQNGLTICGSQTEQGIMHNSTKADGQPKDNSFGVCIDLVVTDIDVHLKHNEEILEKFADAITSNANNEILDRIANSEKETLNNSDYIDGNFIPVVTNSKTLDDVSETVIIPRVEFSNVKSISNNVDVCKVITNASLDENVGNLDTEESSDNFVRCEINANFVKNCFFNEHINGVKVTEKGEIENDNLSDKNNEFLELHNIAQKNMINFIHDDESKIIIANKQTEEKNVTESLYYSESINEQVNSKQTKNNSDIKSRNVCEVAAYAGVTYGKKHENENKIIKNTSSTNPPKKDESIVAVDRVREIAMYLNEFAKKHNKEVHTRSSNRLDMLSKTSKHFDVKAKLRIQGVEKPGGIEEGKRSQNKVSLKTYSNSKLLRHKICSVIPNVVSAIKSPVAEINSTVEDLDISYNIAPEKDTRMVEFCNCSDFGRLAFYDSDVLYEHIHFWERKIIDCNCDVLFSIYGDSIIKMDKGIDNNIEEAINEMQESADSEHSICWNTFDCFWNSEKSCQSLKHTVIDEENYIDVNSTGSKKEHTFESFPAVSDAEKEDSIIITENTTYDNIVHQYENRDQKQCRDSDKMTDEIPNNKKADETDSVILKKESPIASNVVTSEEKIEFNKISETTVDIPEKPENLAEGQNTNHNEEKHMHTTMKDKMNSEEAAVTSKADDKYASNIEMSTAVDHPTDKPLNSITTSKKKTKKRKKPTTVDSNKDHDEVDNVEPPTKKSVKCGVCNQVLAENEWTDHIAQEHSFIAWRSGSSINFKSPELTRELREKLKLIESLKCPSCGSEFKSVKKFLSHVEDCLNRSDLMMIDNNVSSAVSHENTTVTADCSVGEESTTIPDIVNKCGVCNEHCSETQWLDHIATKHNYLAWKDTERPLNLDDEDDLRQHLSAVSRQVGSLKCCGCGLARKYPKLFLTHIKQCKEGTAWNFESKAELPRDSQTQVQENSSLSEDEPLSELSEKKGIKCGVCKRIVEKAMWYEHMGQEHDYMTWEDGDEELDVNDEELVKRHLYEISKKYGHLTCSKCGRTRKYAKSFQQHLRICEGPVEKPANESVDDDSSISLIKREMYTKCGACGKDVNPEKWIQHLKTHNYMAWKEAEPLDINNKEEVNKHLMAILNDYSSLDCDCCDKKYTNVDKYLKHVAACTAEKMVVCAVCSKQMTRKKWVDHKMNVHYNVAWSVGEDPIDVRDSKVVEKLIKEYKSVCDRLVCRLCGISRASCIGFYAHVIVCGKSEEEVEFHKRVCYICHKKYLCVYENQHMTFHKEQEISKERKLREQKKKEEGDAMQSEEVEVAVVPGRRRAAQRARTVIENYQKAISEYPHTCKCGFGSETKLELQTHKCAIEEADYSDSGDSAVIDSEEESDDSAVDSNVSNEELMSPEDDDEQDDGQQKKRRRQKEYAAPTTRIKRFPFTPNDVNTYILKSCEEFYEYYYTTESLFSEWRNFEWNPVAEEHLSKYLPPLEQSCKIKLHGEHWTTFKRFEAKKLKTTKLESPISSVFVGSCIQNISWVPTIVDKEDQSGHFLAVIAHLGSDSPRLGVNDVQPHPGLIQIWDYGLFNKTPKLALGLVHDYGTAWSMAWCPSGGRDDRVGSDTSSRLGLLAVAFSTGSVYIFSVPYPSVIVKDDSNKFYRAKPVVELRLSTGSSRKVQATSVSWSTQKKHETIMVGYSDGYTAFFDLKTESPLLRSKEKDVIILYPYHDIRMSNTCVTGTGMFPSTLNLSSDSVCASSPTGAMMATRAGPRSAAQHSTIACCGALFQPVWPSALITGEDCLTSSSVNELEWLGCGRRLGAGEAAAACAHCARLALAATPLLVTMRRHPIVDTTPKQLVGEFQMTPIAKKRPKSENGDVQNAKKVPRTYDEAVKEYGVEVKLDKPSLDKLSLHRTVFPERFPLAAISTLSFCPSRAHHRRLAIGLHSGFIVIIQI